MSGAGSLPARSYAKISLHDPALLDRHAGGSITEILAEPATLEIPALAYGDTALEGRALLEHPAGGWRDTAVGHAPVAAYRLEDAVVHGPEGLITVGDHVIAESLAHVPLDQIGCVPSESHVVLPHAVTVPLDSACYAMGGGHWNHFHWLIECLPRLRLKPFGGSEAGVALLPPRTRAMQRVVEDILRRHGGVARTPFRGTAIRVGALGIVPNLSGFGFAPHPMLAGFFDTLIRELGVAGDEAPRRKIYVARGDAESRPLTNEAEVIALARRHGFEVVTLEGTTLAGQARVFSQASHIVAPHGAGLANLVFCRPGTAVLELQMDKYVHWAFRRLAGVRRLTYGCVIGEAEREPVEDWVHNLRWSVSAAAVEAALYDPRFMEAGAARVAAK